LTDMHTIHSTTEGYLDRFARKFPEMCVETGTCCYACIIDVIQSIERLARLNVDILCQSHHQVFTGENARTVLRRSIPAALAFKKRVEQLLHEENSQVEKVVARIKSEEYDPQPDPKQPEQAYLLNIHARVNSLLQRLPWSPIPVWLSFHPREAC